jgi:LmbE family N-acetylglucosaminyl deacetylase
VSAPTFGAPRRNLADARRKAKAAAARCADVTKPNYICSFAGAYAGRPHPPAVIERTALAILASWASPLFDAPSRGGK